jgi:hypothetical protein
MTDDHLVPLVLLVYALQTVITTATCIAEYTSWTVIDFDTKIQLGALYGPYMAVGTFHSIHLIFYILKHSWDISAQVCLAKIITIVTGLFMAVDTFLRLKSVITSGQKFVATKKDR